MKIHFDNCNFSSRSGPNTFACRLAHQLALTGHTLADENDYDVMLSFIEQTKPVLPGKKLVQRLDGIWFKPEEFQSKNSGIKACYDRADIVIWQSNFDRGMTTHWWGRPKLGIVIHNGIEMTPVKDFTSPELMAIRQNYDKVFVCSANWHPQKRLSDNIAMFKHLRKTYPKSCLIVMGSNPDYLCADPGIFYSGSLPPELYMQVYSMADWMIHLAWLDHCPNVVIEALSQRTPVICSEAGGTKELVGDNGIVLKETPYNFELANYDDPPHIDVTQVTNLELPTGKFDDSVMSWLNIGRVAHAYEAVFNKVVYNNEVPC